MRRCETTHAAMHYRISKFLNNVKGTRVLAQPRDIVILSRDPAIGNETSGVLGAASLGCKHNSTQPPRRGRFGEPNNRGP